ncbi:MAG: hypothetical protein ABSB34_03725 [Candidatus Limnocylindrales bacterium]|jgi:hypothetical protein
MMSIGQSQLDSALRALGELLAARGLHYEVVVIGGGNLILQGLVTRPTTRDLDLLGSRTASGVERMRPMPEPLRTAVLDVARAYGLADDWVNLGPESLLDFGLPEGLVDRLERRDYRGLVIWLAGRFDMICFKLYAAVDQGPRSRHLQDLEELGPDREELLAAASWTLSQDPSPGYRSMLVETLGRLGVEDADGRLD